MPYSTLALVQLVLVGALVVLSYVILGILSVFNLPIKYGLYVFYFLITILLAEVLMFPFYIIRPDWLTNVLISFGW